MYDIENLIMVYEIENFVNGKKNIYKHCQKGYRVHEKVIMYLRIFNPCMAVGLMYEHPFIKGKRCTGKAYMTDGKYCWDSDTLEYVLNYDLVLPQDFIDHIMSDYGTDFLSRCIKVRNFKEAWEIRKTKPNQPCVLVDFFNYKTKVRYIGKSSSDITHNKIYDCLGREYDTFRIIDESGEDYLYPITEFELIE